jgi:putative membrane protein
MIDYQTGDYMHRIIFRLKGSAMPRAFKISFPSAIVALVLVALTDDLQTARETIGFATSKTTVIWGSLTFPLLTLLSFRTNQAWGRFWEATGLLHAMRGEWFDSASCLATFSFPAKQSKPEMVNEFRHTMLRLMSLCHGSALDELKVEQTEDYEVLDIKGLDERTVQILTECKKNKFNRVEVVLHMIQILVINAQQTGVISIPPPILSRVYQTLSRGFVNLLSAKKIKDTRFPFPYAQIVVWGLMTLAICTPFAMSVMLPHYIWSTVGTFFPVFGTFCLHYIAEELEMPFGDDSNDLPIAHFQEEMNSSLMMLIHYNADHVAKTSSRAEMEWEGLVGSIHDRRNSVVHLQNSNGRGASGMSRRGSVFTPMGEFDSIDEDIDEGFTCEESEAGSNFSWYGEKKVKTNEDSVNYDPSDCTMSLNEGKNEGTNGHAEVTNGTVTITQEQVKHMLMLNEEHEAMVRELMKIASPQYDINGISAPPPSQRPRGNSGERSMDRCHDSIRPQAMTLHSQYSDTGCIPPEQALPEMSRPGNSSWRRQLLGRPSSQPMQQEPPSSTTPHVGSMPTS